MEDSLSHTDHREDHDLKKRLECELPKMQKISSKYRLWWHVQVLTLLVFLVCLVFSVITNWWFLVPACLCLGFSLFANGKRMELSGKYGGIEEAITGKEVIDE